MDMQPLRPPPEMAPSARRRKNQQIISGVHRNLLKTPTAHSSAGSHEEEEPPILMMSSMSGEGNHHDYHPHSSKTGRSKVPDSPSRSALLVNEERAVKGGYGGRAKKTSGKRASKMGMSSKITKALFRERRSHFSKMDSMANDARGSHFKRSARSPFHNVEPRGSTNTNGRSSMDFGGYFGSNQNEASFDNTSTNSQNGPVILEEPKPKAPSVRITVQQLEQKAAAPSPPRPPPAAHFQPLTAKNSSCVLLEPTRNSNVSALSMGSDFSGSAGQSKSFPSQAAAAPLRTMAPAAGTIPPVAPKALSITSSSSSLNYSESYASSYSELTNNYNHNSHQLLGVKLAKSEDTNTSAPPISEVEQGGPNPHLEEQLNTIISDLVQERLLDRLDQAATTPKAAAPAAAKNKKFPSLKPPPSLPPKAPRNKMTLEGAATSPNLNNVSAHSAASHPRARAAGANLTLKQHEERLLQGGDFLNESMESSSSAAGAGGHHDLQGAAATDLPLKLLHRLEMAQTDTQLMPDHHHQDPPLQSVAMSNSVSFGSSTIATLPTNIAIARKISNASSIPTTATMPAESPTTPTKTTTNTNANPYAAFMVSQGLDLPSPSEQQKSRHSIATEPFVEAPDDEEELVVVDAPADEDNEGKLINYLYSQDKEFENSILSHSNTQSASSQHNASHRSTSCTSPSSLPHLRPTSPITPAHSMYRSDAIDAFLEKANSTCSRDHCVAVMEEAATQVLEGGGNGNNGNVNNNPNEDSELTTPTANLLSDPIFRVDSSKMFASEANTDITQGSWYASEANTDITQGNEEDEPLDENEEKTIVSDEFLNMMTSGCTGMPNHAAKEAMKEKLVALEAGWSGFANQFQERIHSLEESWQGWNLNSLLQFQSPSKAAAEPSAEEAVQGANATTKTAREEALLSKEGDHPKPAAAVPAPFLTPTTMGSTTMMTTPSTMATPSNMSTNIKMPNPQLSGSVQSIIQQVGTHSSPNTHAQEPLSGSAIKPVPNVTPKTMFQEQPEDPLQEQLELISQADSSVVGVMKSPMKIPMPVDATEDEVVLGVVRELEKARIRSALSSSSRDRHAAHVKQVAMDEEEAGLERIEIGTTERDVPLSLKYNLADISIIGPGGNNHNNNISGSSNGSSSRPSMPTLDSSREDSEGGKVVLDGTECQWDPVLNLSSSDCPEEEEQTNSHPESSMQAVHQESHPPLPLPHREDCHSSSEKSSGSKPAGGFVFFKRKRSKGKKKPQSSPKSVLVEI